MKIIFAGTPSFALPALQALIDSAHEICAVYTQPDRPAGRGQRFTPSPVKELALKYGLPIYQPQSLKDIAAQQQLREFNADTLVNVAYGMLLPEAVLQIPKFGCINIHPSLLPRWRGAAPIQRAILAGDNTTGVSIMQMDAGLDTGGIYKQATLPIAANDTTQSLLQKSALLGTKLLLEVLTEVANGAAKIIPQHDANSTYATKITKEEGKINWQLSANEIDRLVRAFNPWPVAYSDSAGKTIRIWQAKPLAQITAAAPGTILKADKTGIEIAAGNEILLLEIIQLPNGKPLPVSAILNAYRALFAPGQKFI